MDARGLFVPCAVLVGCGGPAPQAASSDRARTRPNASEQTSEAEEPPRVEGVIPRVELLASGAQPRRVLRYVIPDGSTQRARFWHEQQIRMAGDASPEPVRIPILVVVRLGPTASTRVVRVPCGRASE